MTRRISVPFIGNPPPPCPVAVGDITEIGGIGVVEVLDIEVRMIRGGFVSGYYDMEVCEI